MVQKEFMIFDMILPELKDGVQAFSSNDDTWCRELKENLSHSILVGIVYSSIDNSILDGVENPSP